jgi:phospholipid-binding lipoprotein MlaA
LIVDKRAELLDDTNIRDQAFDPYAFMRDSYMQYRENQVKDGVEDPMGVRPYNLPLGN